MGAVNVDVELLDWLGADLVSVDRATRKVVRASPRTLHLLGLRREDLEGAVVTEAAAHAYLDTRDAGGVLRARVFALLDAPVGTADVVEYPAFVEGVRRWRRLRMRVVDGDDGPRVDFVGEDIEELVEARRERALADALRELSEAVHVAVDLSAAADTVADRVRALLDADRVSVVVFGSRDHELGLRAVSGSAQGIPPQTARAIIEFLVPRFGRLHQVAALDELGAPGLAPLTNAGIVSGAYAVVGDNLGIVSVTSTRRRELSPEELRILNSVAERLAGPLAQKVLEQERAAAALALADARDRLRTAVDAGGIGVFEWDAATSVTTADDTCRRIWEFGDDVVDLSAAVRERVHPDDQSMLERALVRAIEPGSDGTYRAEYRFSALSGTKHLMVRGRFRFDDDGKPSRIMGTLQDVSDARRLEQKLVAAQKLESLGVLAGGIAHDFNNLLVGVLGNAGLAKLELPPNSPVLESIDGIETAALRASELTRQLLAYAGKARFVISSIQLEQLVTEMGHLLTAVIGKGVVVRYQFARGVPPVRGDATQLRQVVMNLITNASDAIGDRSGIVTVSTSLVHADRAYLDETLFDDALEPGDYVCLQVSDTGVGMSQETKARIFEPFYTTKFTGRGLGLAAVQGILRAHRGALKVYSEPGRGTTFKILLPAGDGITDSEARATPTTTAERATGAVLVIDDEETMRNVTRRILNAAGISVLMAPDGVEGVEMYRQRRAEIDLVLLDVTMPRMGGEETFRLLRQLNPQVRVLLASGYSEQEATAQFAGKGLAGFVEKPFQAAVLLEKVKAALKV